MAVTNMRILIRRDTEAMWLANAGKVLMTGEIGYETDKRRMKVGNGVSGWNDLPYFAGGIVAVHPDGGLKLDEAGLLYLDNDMVLGELPEDTNIKDYVDGLIQGEASVRAQEDQLLSDRIDTVSATLTTETSDRQAADSALQQQITALQGSVSDDIGDIAEGTSVKEYVDELIQGEASVRAAQDTIHNSQLNNRYTKDEVDSLLGDKVGEDFVNDRIGTLTVNEPVTNLPVYSSDTQPTLLLTSCSRMPPEVWVVIP